MLLELKQQFQDKIQKTIIPQYWTILYSTTQHWQLISNMPVIDHVKEICVSVIL